MRSKFFIIPAALIFQVAGAQNGPVPLTASQGTFAAVSPAPSTNVKLVDPASSLSSSNAGESIMDYKSVYEAATVEEEVQMAADRFRLTKSQQEIWLTAAIDRRQGEKQAYEKLKQVMEYDKNAVYMGLRMSQNTFYETVTGYLTPAQKQSLELDRTIRNEKQRRLAKLPPPPPPAPTVTVAPVDSAAIKEAEKVKAPAKKSKKKKKPAGA
ncbi:MAG: hypothetical protein K0S53_1972 [Bacteroidetes bacterium]|jgi:hypothetical protein|nr:hypothetical protein [Bacteroidota bacterium]MDF2451038.1 hypothetical protein [Bacteroidota bacterium]